MASTSNESLADFTRARAQAFRLSAGIVVLMMGALAGAVALLAARLSATWNGIPLVVISLLIALEAFLSHGRAAQMELRERLIFRVSELVAFAVLAKLSLYLNTGFGQLLADLPRWQENFLESFFTGAYMLMLIVMLVIWFLSLSYAGDLEDLLTREIDAQWDELGKLVNALTEIRGRIAARVFFVGIGVTAMAVFSRLDVGPLQPTPAGIPAGLPVWISVAYFLLALLLLSQTQFALLRARWSHQKLTISPGLSENWWRWGLVSFLVLAVIVIILPREYSIGLFDTLRLAVNYLMQAFSFLMFLFMLPFTLCLSLLSLFGQRQQPNETQAQPPPVLPTAPPAAEPVAWLEFLRSLLFWLFFLSIIFLALRYYLQQNAALWKAILRFPLFRMAAAWFQALQRLLRGANRQARTLFQAGIRRLRASRVPSPFQAARRMIDLSRLSPRERIIHLYLVMVHLGEEHGLRRRPSQTPLDYERQIHNEMPEIDPELHALTDAFLEARYSQHPVDQNTSEQAASLLERIRAYLRTWKKDRG
jgi:hypothetical protein